MRLLTGQHRVAYEAILQALASAQAECAATRSEIRRLTALSDSLQRDRDRERQRADNAIDELLAMRGIAPISVPPEPRDLTVGNPFKEDPEQVEKIEADMKKRGFGVVLEEVGKAGG